MKKFLGLVAVVMLFASSAFATTVSTVTYSGLADFTGSGEIAFSFNLKNVANDSSATSLAWTSSEAFNKSTTTVKWVRCDQYAVVAATVTKAGFAVYMYQTNKQSTDFKAETPRVNADKSKVYSGLVNQATKGGAYRGYIPVAYSLVPVKNADITFDGTIATGDDRADRYFVDAADETETGGEGSNFDRNYGMVAYSNIGVVFGPYDEKGAVKPWSSSKVVDNTAYMYFFGGFVSIQGGDKYGTDQLHMIQVTE